MNYNLVLQYLFWTASIEDGQFRYTFIGSIWVGKEVLYYKVVLWHLKADDMFCF